MVEVTYWIADDGTQFEDKDQCAQYENGLMWQKVKNDIEMWDSDFEIVDDFCDASFIKVKTMEAARWLNDYGEQAGIYTPYTYHEVLPGFYFYDNGDYYWEDWVEYSSFFHEVSNHCGVD